MKLSLFFMTYTAMAQDRTKAPTKRLELIDEGLQDWCDEWITSPEAKDKLDLRLGNLIDRMEDQFAEPCAILEPPNKEVEEVDEEYADAVRAVGMDSAVERMRKYLRVLTRVSRIYLADCPRPGKNKRMAGRLADKFERAYNRIHN